MRKKNKVKILNFNFHIMPIGKLDVLFKNKIKKDQTKIDLSKLIKNIDKSEVNNVWVLIKVWNLIRQHIEERHYWLNRAAGVDCWSISLLFRKSLVLF